MTPFPPQFAQKSRSTRGYPLLRYGDAMRDSILAPVPHPSSTAGSPGQSDQVNAPLLGDSGRVRPRERKTLTRADWTGAALDALARDGLRAVAVEPLAERLGATKGSFYWHFRDRNALLEAAVAQWERT